jgi:hypothetical protein
MASSIPRARRKEYADTLVAKTLKVALFVDITGYDPITATTLTALKAGGATEVSNAGTGYTTGGYTLAGKAASNVGATNVSIVTTNPTAVASATFTCRYAVIYDTATDKIEGISDFLAAKTVTNGTITVTWDATAGLVNIA